MAYFGEVKRAVFEQEFLSCASMVLITLLERGRVGGDTQPRPITSPDRPGLSRFFVVLRGRPGARGYIYSAES